LTKSAGFDVFFYEAFAEERELLQKLLPENIRAGYASETIQEAGHDEPPALLISTRTQSRIPHEWAQKLNGILSRSTGYNHLLDYQSETEFKGAMGYLPLYCNRAVAEQAMMLWMALLRKLSLQIEQFNTFSRDGLTGLECSGKTLLVVGVGNVGHEVVRIGRGLDMRVLGVDIVKKFDDVDYVAVEQGAPKADIIVSAMNLTRKNRGYFHYDLLKKFRKGVIFVNIARGELSPIKDLFTLLKEGHLGGAALDVYENESRLAVALRNKQMVIDDPFFAMIHEMKQMPNVIFTPHNSFNTKEALQRKAEHSVKQVVHFLENNAFLWDVPEE